MNSLRKHFPWGLMAFLAIGITIAAVGPYTTLNSANFNGATARYATETNLKFVSLFVHAFSGGIALIIGPFQFLSGLRNRRPTLHRWMGRIYLTAILIGGLSAFIIAPGLISGLVGEIGLMTLAALWLWTGLMAYINIRTGNVEVHRDWMTRNYALTFAGVTLRLWLGILIATQLPMLATKYENNFDNLFVEVYRLVMWLSWVPNLIVAEWIINRRRAPKAVTINKQISLTKEVA
ncbi:MAG: DUF2306 domain-containing protein [Anaerolineales bacterium]|nr:DUF2306 domain-containing protein [Anaerolineales bacterium]